MQHRYEKIYLQLSKYIDLGLVALAFILSYFLKKYLPFSIGGLSTGPNYYLLLLLMLITCNFSFKFFGFYSETKVSLLRTFTRQVKAVSCAVIVFIVENYILHVTDMSRLFLLIFTVLILAFLFLKSWLSMYARGRLYRIDFRNLLVIGSRARAYDTIEAIHKAPGQHFRVVGCLETDAENLGKKVYSNVKVIGTLADFRNIIYAKAINEVIFAMPLKDINNADQYIMIAEEVGVHVRIMPDWQIQKMMYQTATANVAFEQFLGLPTLSLSSTPRKTAQLFVKELIDYIGASVGLVLLSPLLVLVAFLIKISSPGPIIFAQMRSGLYGRQFRMYKFRSMVTDAESLRQGLADANEQQGPVFKIRKDPRITLVGKILRRTSLDELPQLFNVLKGEMSLVGPRPPIPAEVEHYEPWQRRRLSMKPGLTCIWQVSGRNNISFDKWMKLDLEYIDEWSLLLDLKLLLLTVRAVIFTSGH